MSHDRIVQVLLNDRTHDIEFNGHLTNHNKHAVIALAGLGASKERIQQYYDSYAKLTPYGYGLEPARPSKYSITDANWDQFLGKRTSYSSYCEFFDQKEKDLGMDEVLKRYFPKLLPGWVGSFTHATIHLGWALGVNHRWMAIEGLAYMAFSYVPCHPDRARLGDDRHQEPVDSLLALAEVWGRQQPEMGTWVEDLMGRQDQVTASLIHPELVRSGLQFRIAKMLHEGHPLIYSLPTWVEKESHAPTWEHLYYCVTLIYLSAPGDFVLLHLITALYAMEQISLRLPSELQSSLIKNYWIGILCVIFSQGKFPSHSKLEELNSKYKTQEDNPEQLSQSWDQTVSRAILEEEEHNPKMVYVLKKVWKRSGYRSIYRVAAEHFTTTPILPKSFEDKPIEETPLQESK